MRNFWRALLDFIAPRMCAVCGERLLVCEEYICKRCMRYLPRIVQPKDEPEAFEEHVVAKRLWGLANVVRGTAWMRYSPADDTAGLIRQAKYKGDIAGCWWLGRMAATDLLETGFFVDVDCIVPMPSTRGRMRWRGYNQCEEIARGISAVTGIPVETKAVRRRRFTVSQTRLHGFQRNENVEGVFEVVHPQRLEGKHILLIDDVITTGATMVSLAMTIAPFTVQKDLKPVASDSVGITRVSILGISKTVGY